MSHVTVAQNVCPHVIHVSSAWCCCLDFSTTLHFALFTVSLIFFFILLIFIFIFHVGWFGEKVHCALPRMRSYALWPTTILSHFIHYFLLKTQKDFKSINLTQTEKQNTHKYRHCFQFFFFASVSDIVENKNRKTQYEKTKITNNEKRIRRNEKRKSEPQNSKLKIFKKNLFFFEKIQFLVCRF